MSDQNFSAPANASPGEKVAGYLLEEQIGQGGMAVVFRARDERLGRRVALKLLAPGLAADTAFHARAGGSGPIRVSRDRTSPPCT